MLFLLQHRLCELEGLPARLDHDLDHTAGVSRSFGVGVRDLRLDRGEITVKLSRRPPRNGKAGYSDAADKPNE